MKITRLTRVVAMLFMLVFVILLIWRPGHSLLPAFAFWAGAAMIIVVDLHAGSSQCPQLEVMHIPPEVEDFERGVMGMVGTEDTFMRSITGIAQGVCNMGPELILYAAIKHPDDHRIFAVSRPGRHHHVQQLMEMLNSADPYATGPDHQGFITTLGCFVYREEALVIAQKHRQIIEKHPAAYELYSEDMWASV